MRLWAFLLLLVGLLALFFIDLAWGSIAIPLQDIAKLLLKGHHENQVWQQIIYKIRLPKALTAVLAGSALAVSGLQMQTLFRNPLAGPSVLGITAGASLGVALVVLGSAQWKLGFSSYLQGLSGSGLVVVAACLGAAFTFVLIMMVAYRISDHIVLLLIGLMVGNITSALVGVAQYFSRPEQIQDYLIWTFGSLGGVLGNQLWVFAGVVLIGFCLILVVLKDLNLLLLGETYARSMGVGVVKVRIFVIASTALLTGVVTAFCGPIAFVGVAVPHIARVLFSSADHRLLLPSTAILGAILLLFCDIFTHLPGSSIALPINAVTSVIGSVIVLMVVLKSRDLRRSF
ncbi:MAG TPA: iron ABC transporter [Microscillaceae bacterium]|jgi:iron complex transport system permease protein|nr:iron ABC transporter [Microscillaceae bacterium]